MARAAGVLVLPVFLIASMAGLAWALALELPPLLAIAIGGALFGGLTILLERWLPYDQRWQRSHGDLVTDALHLVVTGIVVSSLPGLVIQGSLANVWPTAWPFGAQVALALIAKDFCVYWSHRALHRLWWRVHAIHHSAPRLYWLNAWRAHPLEGLISATAALVPLIALGAPPDVALYTWSFTAVFAMVQHSNLALSTALLDRVLATPAVHRWHHAPAADANYGNIFSIWDQLFGTYRVPLPAPAAIGGPDVPPAYLDQLRSPFASNASSTR